MSEVAPESAVAGRLEVPVESDLKGFGKKLKQKIETATKGVKGTVEVEPDGDGFKTKLEEVVKQAAAGVKAEIGIDVDAATLKARIEAAAKAAGAQVQVSVDTAGLVAEARAAATAAEAATRDGVQVPLVARSRAWLAAQTLKAKAFAQSLVSKNPIQVPLVPDQRAFRRPRLRGIIRGTILVSLVSLIQPAVGALVQLAGGVTALAGAVGPATGTLAALPLGISALLQSLVGVTTATQGFGSAISALTEKQKALADGTGWTAEQQAELDKALANLSPSARKTAKAVAGLRDEWSDLRKQVQEALFSRIADQVKPLADAFLPKLQKGLTGTAAAVGDVARGFMVWMQTRRFLSNFSGVMRQNNATIGAGGKALRFLVDGFLEFQRAAEPFQARMDRWITRSAKWFRNSMRINRENGDTARFLEKAGDRLNQVWTITKRLGSGLLGVFRAGEDSGVRLLTSLERWLTKWSTWVNSDPGQKRIQTWFDNTEKGFREIGYIVRDTFNAVLGWAEDPKIVGLLRQIRTELGPALNDLFTALSDLMAENVVAFFTELAEALVELEPALKILAQLTEALVAVMDAANDLIAASGPVGDAILTILGALVALRTLRKFGGAALGGGLIAGLLGKGGAGGVAAAAAATGAMATQTTRLSKATRLLKGLGKGAGFFALVEGVPKLLETFRYDITNSGIDTAVSQFSVKLNRAGQVVSADMDAIRAAVANSQVGSLADDFGINLDRLSQGIYDALTRKAGDPATAAQRYFDDVRARMKEAGSKANLGDAFSDLWGGNTDLKSNRFSQGLEEIFDQFTGEAAQAQREFMDQLQKAKQARKELTNLLTGGITGKTTAPKQPKGTGNRIYDSIVGGPAPKVKPPKVETKDLFTSLSNIGKRVKGAFSGLKLKALKLPKVDTKSLNGVSKTVGRAGQQASEAFRKKITLLPGIAEKGAKQADKKTDTGLNALVKTVRSKQGPTKAASTRVANSVQEPMKGLNGKMRTSGVDAMSGLMAGIQSRGAAAVAAARSIANQVAAATRAALKTKSPSRVMMEIGRNVSDGLAIGITKNGKKVEKARKNLIGGVAGSSLRRDLRAMTRAVDESLGAMKKAAEKTDQATKKGEDAHKKRLAAMKRMAKELTATIVSGQKEYGSLSNLSSFAGGYLTPSFAIGELTRRVDLTKSFRANLKALRKKGLGKAAYRELLEMGVEEGSPIVDQLLTATPQQLKRINALKSQLVGLGKGLGADAKRAMGWAGKQAAKGMADGLRDNQKVLNQAARGMAQALAREVKRALKIKSPSRVMAGLGAQTVEGMRVGIDGRAPRLMSSARAISKDLARGLTPGSTHAATLYRASRAAGARMTDMRAAAGAPLVGELSITTGTKEEVRDALDEAMFALRKIRQGGVYADRTA